MLSIPGIVKFPRDLEETEEVFRVAIVARPAPKDDNDDKNVYDAKELNLSNKHLKAIQLDKLIHYTLKLNLNHNAIDSFWLREPLPSLTEFSAEHNELTYINVSKMPKLSSLSLSHNSLVSVLSISELLHLTKLDLSGNRLSQLESLAGVANNLLVLHLKDNLFRSLADIKGLRALKALESFEVSQNFLLLDSTIGELTSLKRLVVGHFQLTETLRDQLPQVHQETDASLDHELNREWTQRVVEYYTQRSVIVQNHQPANDTGKQRRGRASSFTANGGEFEEWTIPCYHASATYRDAQHMLAGEPARTCILRPSQDAHFVILAFVLEDGEIAQVRIGKLANRRYAMTGGEEFGSLMDILNMFKPLPPTTERLRAVNEYRATLSLPPLTMETKDKVSSESIENNSNNHLKLPNSTSKKAQNSNGAFDNIDDFVWLRSQEFFWPEMDKTAAEEKLGHQAANLFVVRPGESDGFSLALCPWEIVSFKNEKQEFVHLKAKFTLHSVIMMEEFDERVFQSVEQFQTAFHLQPLRLLDRHRADQLNSFRRQCGLSELVANDTAVLVSNLEKDCGLYLWFFPLMTKEQAEKVLTGQVVRTFVVRPSSDHNTVVLSMVNDQNAISHISLQASNDGKVLVGDQSYADVEEIIRNHVYGVPFEGDSIHIASVRERQQEYAKKQALERQEWENQQQREAEAQRLGERNISFSGETQSSSSSSHSAQSSASKSDAKSDASALKSSTDDEDEDKHLCVVCFEPRNTVLIPCGHVCLCMFCANKLSTCPICSAKIEQRYKFYYS